MKLLLLSAANSVHTVRWANAFAERGNEVYLVYNKGHENRDGLLAREVKTIELPVSGFKGYYLNARYFKKVVRSIQPELVHTHYASGYGTLMRLAGVKNGILSVWGSDVYEFPFQNPLFHRIVVKNLKSAKHLVATSECMAGQVCKILGKNLPITITPFGVDINRFSSNDSYKKTDDEILIGNVKSLKPIYAIDVLIRAIHKLITELSAENSVLANRIHCHIYGEGELREELEELIKELEMEDVIILKGYVPNSELPKILSSFDVFCATSIHESFGVSVVEAQAMGLPVVVSNNDGFAEVVEKDVSGLIVPVQDVEATASALKKLILDPELRKRMGEEGRKRVVALYDWNKNVDIMEKLYTDVIEKRNRI